MARKPLWQEIEEMSPRERINSVKQHNQNLNRFMTATSESVDKLSIIRKAIKKSEKKSFKHLSEINRPKRFPKFSACACSVLMKWLN